MPEEIAHPILFIIDANTRYNHVMETKYIHQREDWPNFRWDTIALADQLATVRNRQGFFLGKIHSLGFGARESLILEVLTDDVQKTSEIEGDVLERTQVRSSVARRLGLDSAALAPADRRIEGVVDTLLDATQHYDQALTKTRMFGWHAALFPNGYSGLQKIIVGSWRDDAAGSMRVVSGAIGRERVHYEAPAASMLELYMDEFLKWFESPPQYDPVLKAALAHLWFVTIHPFDDGNGRIGRAIADMALARSEHSSQRFYSMSAQTQKERREYYDTLERTQKGDLDVTEWIIWFLTCLDRSIGGAAGVLHAVSKKTDFWDSVSNVAINERQRKMLNRLLDGFDGKLTAKKWALITKTSMATALRDINDLIGKGILTPNPGGGRSASYSLAVTLCPEAANHAATPFSSQRLLCRS